MVLAKPIRRRRHTKIVATVGPVTAGYQNLKRLFMAGVDAFRLNFSHGNQEEHGENVRQIRQLEEEVARPISVIADLQGPKLRIGQFMGDEITLTPGQKLLLDRIAHPGDHHRVELPHPEVFKAVKAGQRVLLDDGKVHLKVLRGDSSCIETEVTAGRHLSSRKGVSVPGVVLAVSPLTAKDRSDLTFALECGVDWIALSFVQRAEDVEQAREIIGSRAGLLSKLEKPSAAICQLEKVVQLSDAVMLARGDLGVETLPEEVPILQHRILRCARQAGKPVIVATQMLESMIDSPSPTRAEASDVATAIYDGADALMLSAETATGKYPLEAVNMMDRIACKVEKDALHRTILNARRPSDDTQADIDTKQADAITAAACEVARTLEVKAIVTYTTSGSTALRAARMRPEVPILGLTPKLATARRLALSYGVHSMITEDVKDVTQMRDKAVEAAQASDLAKAGERLVITAGVPFGRPGNTNLLRLAEIESEPQAV